MSNFLTRLVDRTLGLSEVVQPSIVPIFVGEVTIGDVSSMPPPLAEKNSDIEENRESSQLPGTEAPSSRADFLPIHPELNKTTIPEKPMPSDRFAGNRTDSKSNVVTEAGKQLNAIPFLSKKEVERKLSPKLRKPESRDGLPPEREMKEVISAQIETSPNAALSKKPDLCAVKSYNAEVSSMHSPESPSIVKRLQDTDKEAPSLTSLAFERVIPAEVFVKQEQTEPSIVDHHSDEREVFSALPNIKVTIGRIDVRTVKQRAPSPSRRRKVAPAPKLSLDDYLKERRRENR